MTLPLPAGSVGELAAGFTTPDAASWGPVPIWWWSGAPVELDRLGWQMEQLLSQGVAQAVVMNLAPTGPLYGALSDEPHFASPTWWCLLEAACERADALGFRLWPYDQIGFSGANLQGTLVSTHPAWAGRSLDRRQQEVLDGHATVRCPQGATPLAAWVVTDDGPVIPVPVLDGTATWIGPGARLDLAFTAEEGFAYDDDAACAALIDTVHGEFARRVGRWFGTVIPGFFQDELPSLPGWGRSFASSFADAFGYDLVGVLPALWGERIEATPGHEGDRVRRDYQAHRARRAREAFFDPLAAWFTEHGLICGFDQQSPAREGDPSGSVGVYGDYTGTHAGFGAPGSDHWGDPKLHSSLASAHGHPRTWIEAFHSSGWGGTLEETYDWLAPFLRRGATLYDPHAVYYATPGGWWEWAPPSTCWRQPYWPDYHVFSGAVARLCRVLSSGSLVADVILVHPTSTAQAGMTLEGALPSALAADAAYHALNGRSCWYREETGVLEGAGIDHATFDEEVVAAARIEGSVLSVGGTGYRTVVLPAMTALSSAAAARLADFADAGGQVIAVGSFPTWFPGPGGEGSARFAAAIAARTILAVATPGDVPAAVRRGPVRVEADVPAQLRRVASALVVALFAHDERTGTRQPMMSEAVDAGGMILASWDAYWSEAHTHGYEFTPVTDRRAHVVLHGLDDPGRARAQQWDPSTGSRRDLTAHARADGALEVEVGFDDGSIALLVVGHGLPPADGVSPGDVLRTSPVSDWTVEAVSTADNSWGDLGVREQRGVLPLQIWRLRSAQGEPDEPPAQWPQVLATFGPFAEVTDPTPQRATGEGGAGERTWREAQWSLTRGLERDPAHGETLGPKGYVPEEFLHWDAVAAGWSVGVRTSLDVPGPGSHLVVGAAARRVVVVDGEEGEVEGAGYWSATGVDPGRRDVLIWLQADADGPLRASFALVSDRAAYQRPEWIVPADGSVRASTVRVRTRFAVAEGVQDARIQVGSEQPTTVTVNGVEVGRQSAFDPYEQRRFARFHPYDLGDVLRDGENEIVLTATDNGRAPAVLVDAVPARLGGLGVLSGEVGWTVERDGAAVATALRRVQWQHPRTACLLARAHPLPGAAWLEAPVGADGVVADVVPDLDHRSHRPQWLALDVPVGATALHVPTSAAFTAQVDGRLVEVEPGDRGITTLRMAAPARAGSTALLRWQDAGGRRGGAVLDGPVTVDVAPAPADLADWGELGFGALAGAVRYRTRLDVPVDVGGHDLLELDLGGVRGTAAVLLDGVPIGARAWSPYRFDLTSALPERSERTSHDLEVVVRGTLGGYLAVASPTPEVFAGQERAGLYGPVRLRWRERLGRADPVER